MAINDSAKHEEAESEEESEEESSSGDESYDYGFADGDDEDEEDSDYEVDYSAMNVSPEILRMLGASEEVIAAKEAEVSGITSTWVPPTETGLEHSAAIADSAAVAIGGGGAPDGTEVKRVFKAVGSFDNDDAQAAAAAPVGDAPVIKVKISHAPEPVPKKYESKLPPNSDPEDRGSDGDGDDDGSSDGSWDEASIIDGHAWWESGSEGEEDLATSTMSPNLQLALGLTPAPKGSVVTTGGGETGGSSWQPPSFSGLANSKPLTTLKPVVIGSNSTGLQVEYKKGASRDGGQGGDDGDEWSEEEGWDYEDVPDDEYVLDWSTNISPNLARAMGQSLAGKNKVEALSAELSWRPPSSFGLKNSAPIVDTSRRSFAGKQL